MNVRLKRIVLWRYFRRMRIRRGIIQTRLGSVRHFQSPVTAFKPFLASTSIQMSFWKKRWVPSCEQQANAIECLDQIKTHFPLFYITIHVNYTWFLLPVNSCIYFQNSAGKYLGWTENWGTSPYFIWRSGHFRLSFANALLR